MTKKRLLPERPAGVRGSLAELAALVRRPRTLAVAVLANAVFVLVVAIPTDLIDTGLFSRQIPPTWWAWPALVTTSALGGLITATYVRPASDSSSVSPQQLGEDDRTTSRGTTLAGLLTFFAVGCPVCNKLVLLALGATGAVTWFQPFQPVLQVVALALLGWALARRLRNRRVCRLPPAADRLLPVNATKTP